MQCDNDLCAEVQSNDGFDSQCPALPRLRALRRGVRLSADCWCAAEPYRLPMTKAALEDCLCPACLRKAAAAREHL